MIRLRGNDGFSTLEVLVALTLFAVIAAGLTGTTIGSIRANRTSKQTAAAATLIYDKVEQVRSLASPGAAADLLPGAHADPNNPLTPLGVTPGMFTRSWVVVRNRPKVGMAEVVITIAWTDTTEHSIRGVTYVCTSGTCS